MNIELEDWDIQDHLKTPAARQAYLEAALEDAGDDPAFIAKALGDIAKSYGMAKLAEETGLTREGLYKALNKKGNPSFANVIKITRALGIKICLQTA